MLKQGNPPVALGKIKIHNAFGRGWTMMLNLKGGTYADAHANFAPILTYLNTVLARDITVADWSISDSNTSNDGYKSEAGVDLHKYRLTGADVTGPPVLLEACNNLETAINVRFATGTISPSPGTPDGRGLTLQFRGIRDSWIFNETPTSTLRGQIDRSYSPTALSEGVVFGLAWWSLLYYIMVGAQWARNTPSTGPGDDGTNDVKNFVRATVRPTVSHRDTGRDPSASKGRIKRQFV